MGEQRDCGGSTGIVSWEGLECMEPRVLLSTAGPVSHFQWDTISSPQTADVPFTATITAKDAEDNTVTGFTGPVSLSGQVGPRSVTIGAGTGKWDYPLHTSYHDARTQMIYEAGELGGGGPITSLALNVTTVPQVLYNWTIRIKHTALSAFTTNTWESTGWTTVYQSKQIISSTGWTTFVFSTPFDYDGVSNLMVDLSFRNSYSNGGSGSVQATLTSQNRSLTCSAGPEQGDPLAWSGTSSPAPSASTYLPNIRLNLGTPVAMTPTVSGSFVNGIWTGQVTVPQRATGMYLNAADGSSHVGTSNTFDVAYIGNLGVTVPASATEGNGVLAGQGMVTVWPAPTSNLRVTLASSDTTEVTVPATVTILAGQTSATFDLTVINDTYRDGSQIATISATAASYPTGLGTIAIHDNETATLTVTMPTSAGEGAGMLTGAGTVKVSAAPGSNVTVNLTSSDTSELMVPATVTILAGQTSATFDVTIVDDTVIDGTKTVAVVAHVENWTDGTASMNVLDNESRALEVSSMGGRDYENQGVQAGAGRVSLSGPLEPAADLVVTLASSDLTELTVPATVTIPAGRASAAFDLTPVDDTECDGGQTVTVTASAEGFAGGSNCTTVLDNEVHHFAFDTIASSKTAGVPFFVAVEARDIDNSTITVFTGTVGLSGSGDGGAISVTPPSDMAFVAGRWRGYVALNRVDTNLVLTANDGAGHVGISNAFNLVAPSEVHGSTWTDLDGDGLRDVGEPALPGWMVYLDNNNNGQWDASELSQVTDADGRYSFAYLAAGTYAVREVIPSGWIQTCPGGTGTKAVTLALGQVASGIDIGNWVVSPGEIQGTQWNDLDGDGVRDAGEPPLAGRTVYLDTNRNGQWDAGEPSQVTDTNGQYAFTYLPAGTYSVGEVTPPGWRQTLPSGAGTTNLIVNGGFETGSFAGWTYPDMGTGVFLVDNGSYDPTSSDGPLSPYNGVFNALTDLGGAGPLEFHSQEGWSVPVAPGSCVHVVRGPAPGYCGPVPAGATDYGFEDIGGPNSAFLRYGDYDDIVLRVYDNNPSVAFLIWVTASYSNSILSNGQPLMQLPSFFGAVDPPLAIPIAPVGASVLYQDVAIPAGATAALSWVDMIRNHAAAFQDPDQEYRVEVRNTADQVLATVFSTNSGDPLLQDWTPRNADLSAFAGQTVRIAFVEQHSMAPLNVHIDDVAVTGTGGNWPIPVTLAGGQVVTGKDFGNRCMVSVNPKTTDDATPSLTGTVDDPTATIAVTVGGQTYPAVNHGDGTWTLADDVVSPALGRGVYDVQVTATDATLNAGSDATTNELIVYKLMADANLDGEVGVEDFGLLKENFGLDGLANAWGVGDFNGDGEVGVEDFGLLKENFGLDEPRTPTPLMAAYGPTGAGVFPNAADAADAAEDDKLDILDTLADLAPVLDLTVV